MTLQEAQALSVERQANLAYRKRIQRIKNTLLGVLFGGVAGGTVGGAMDMSEWAGRNVFSKSITDPSTRRARLGALIGSLTGGLGGYGLTRLKESYDESAGLDPTLTHFMVSQQPTQ